jgi:hypothetical protein
MELRALTGSGRPPDTTVTRTRAGAEGKPPPPPPKVDKPPAKEERGV